MSDIETMIECLTDRQRREFALACARRDQHLMTDPRSIAALDTRERWLRGEATDEEMEAARDAARAAARDTARAAEWHAASAALRAASWDGEWYAAWDAALAAALAASRQAEWEAESASAQIAARNAAWDAELAWQRGELERMLKEGGGA